MQVSKQAYGIGGCTGGTEGEHQAASMVIRGLSHTHCNHKKIFRVGWGAGGVREEGGSPPPLASLIAYAQAAISKRCGYRSPEFLFPLFLGGRRKGSCLVEGETRLPW